MTDTPSVNGDITLARQPRLPRWTRREIMILIEGKRIVESRGKNRAGLVAGPVEPKWAAVSGYCKKRGVDRGPVQCRKRWSNLAGDFKKIKEWEVAKGGEKGESYWGMRNDVRREKRLPGFFDREVFDILEGKVEVEVEVEEEEEVVFDSGRTAGEDGLFSEGEEEEEEEEEGEGERVEVASAVVGLPAVEVRPISEKKFEAPLQQCSNAGMQKGKQPVETPDKAPPSPSPPLSQGQKRRKTSPEENDEEPPNLQSQLIEVLERNSRLLTAQLEAHNASIQLDREQRKDQTDGLLCVLSKVADALGRIADKL